ncbi:MAG: YeeE/YedE family protein [Saccharospirillum sp.]
MNSVDWVVLGGGLMGLLFGGLGQRSGFCLLRGLNGSWLQQDGRKLKMFFMAMAVALLATQVLVLVTGLDLGRAHYLQRNPAWLAIVIGGVLFGYGMVLANACGARSLVLLGQGNLRSLVVLLCLGVAAYMASSGVLAPVRLWLESLARLPLPAADLPALVTGAGIAPGTSRLLVSLPIALLLLYLALRKGRVAAEPANLLASALIGLLVAAGWWVTGVLGDDVFDPARLATLTFIAPIGESIQYLMIATGMSLSFGISVVTGVFLGSLIVTLVTGQFQWQGYQSLGQLQRGIAGGLLMGVGGVMALGCSIGQGLSGFSTLSITSLVALVAILLGAWLGLKGPLRVPSQSA